MVLMLAKSCPVTTKSSQNGASTLLKGEDVKVALLVEVADVMSFVNGQLIFEVLKVAKPLVEA